MRAIYSFFLKASCLRSVMSAVKTSILAEAASQRNEEEGEEAEQEQALGTKQLALFRLPFFFLLLIELH